MASLEGSAKIDPPENSNKKELMQILVAAGLITDEQLQARSRAEGAVVLVWRYVRMSTKLSVI